MLTCKRLRSTDSPHFVTLDALYMRAFPQHKQRESDAKLQALSHPCYALEAWFNEGVFIGLSDCWQFAGYGYIEYLAIDDTLRFRGYGKQLLAQILMRAPLTILETDPLTTTIAHKRLRLYQLMEFHVSAQAHHYLSYYQGIVDYELLVLSYPQSIDERQYQQFAQGLGREVIGWEQPGMGRRPAPGTHWL